MEQEINLFGEAETLTPTDASLYLGGIFLFFVELFFKIKFIN
jgi:hypothetical protein